MSCKKGCYEAVLQSCSNIIVRAAFPTNYPIYWIIQKFGSNNIYQHLSLTNSNGELLINKSDLPDGYLVSNSYYKIQLRNGNDYLQPVTFVFGGQQFNCIQAKLVNITRNSSDNSEVNVIEFKQSLIAASMNGNANSIVYPFANQTTFTYTHNLGRIVSVTFYNLAGEIMTANVTDDTVNHNFITVSFTSPSSGRLLIL